MNHILRPTDETPPLRQGDRLTQAEFHRRYEQYPEDVKYELVDGVVYMASPVHQPHSKGTILLSAVLALYEEATPGVEALQEITTILGERSEPQPDLSLRILTEYGGQSHYDEKGYLVGPAELIVEVEDSSEKFDLSSKRKDYERAGVREYLVLGLETEAIRWFDFGQGNEIRGRGGVFRSRVFPGLWVDGKALLSRDLRQLLRVAREGLASPAHARLVDRLHRAHQRWSRQQAH